MPVQAKARRDQPHRKPYHPLIPHHIIPLDHAAMTKSSWGSP